jgi:hypothetical protein
MTDQDLVLQDVRQRDRAARRRQAQIRSWLAVTGAVAPVNAARLACEPIRPWIAGMAVGQSGTGSDMRQEASA